MSKVKIHDYIYSYGKPFATINQRDGYRQGNYIFDGGVVIIYTERKYTCFTFYYKGICYSRSISGKVYTDIGLARLAGKFGRKVMVDVASQSRISGTNIKVELINQLEEDDISFDEKCDWIDDNLSDVITCVEKIVDQKLSTTFD